MSPTPRLEPVVVDGVMRPDLDRRFVPRATMARYLGVSGETIYQRTLRGEIPPDALKRFGSRTWYRPDVICGSWPAGWGAAADEASG